MIKVERSRTYSLMHAHAHTHKHTYNTGTRLHMKRRSGKPSGQTAGVRTEMLAGWFDTRVAHKTSTSRLSWREWVADSIVSWEKYDNEGRGDGHHPHLKLTLRKARSYPNDLKNLGDDL